MRYWATIGLILGMAAWALAAHAAKERKVVFLAGTKSHGPGDHEYEKACRLLARSLETSPNLKGYRTEVHLYGWPDDPKTLDDADTIVLYSDGSDHVATAHPFLVGDRMQTIARQMKRGCGLVLIHYATIAPIGHDEFLDWTGGHFDYETGPGANHWASAIKFCDAEPIPGSPKHPISRGLTPFDLREEYYYKIRFAKSDRRLAPILNVNIPDEPDPQTVAWAVERKDGGRGFGTTCGHPYANFQNDNLRRVLLNAIVWSAHGEVPVGGVQSTVDPACSDINALILTGHAHPAHDWRATTEAIKAALARDPRIKVTVWEDPEKLATSELQRFDVLIQNYQNWERPTLSDAARKGLLEFVRSGKGLVLIHFADGSWRDWPDYAGRLSRRVWIDGKSSHDAFGPFTVNVAKPDNLLTRGLQDFQTTDELYCNQQGDLPVDPLLTAHSKITNRDEPLAYVYSEGKGRIFQTLLGHAAESVRTPSVSEVLRRAVAWCANREVLPLALDATPAPRPANVEEGAGAPLVPKPTVRPKETALVRSALPIPTVDPKTSVDWPNVGNDKGGMRYSALRQINRDNVNQVQVAWTYHCDDHDPKGNTTIECTPIVIDGVMYLTTVRVNVVALDAATGKEIWRFDPKSGGVNRGVGYWSDGLPNGKRRIIVSLSNGFMYSLNAVTGDLDKEFGDGGIVDLRKGLDGDIARFGYGSSSAPAIFEDLVILGFLSSEVGPGAPGDVRAFDARTGKERWRFHTVPRPGEVGYETWPPNSWKDRGGVNPWGGFTVDAVNGIVFCGTGSASSDFYGKDRIGDNLFANCTLALDARTGKRLWHFQSLHHDLWDRDVPCPPVVCTVKQNGKSIEVVAQPTKTGYLFVFDRKTGKPLFKVEEKPVPPSDVPGEQASRTQPVPVKPPSFARQQFTEDDVTNVSPESHDFVLDKLRGYKYGSGYYPPSLQGSAIIPGFHGGATWSGASFDPAAGLLFVNSNNVPWVATLREDAALGYNFTGWNYFRDQSGNPANKPPWGLLTAIDVSRGEFAWQVVLGHSPELESKGVPQTGTENFGGTIVTAGGLVFIGASRDEMFHAFDSRSGKLLWEYKLPAGGYATPSTYMVNGRQYVVIACGGGGKLKTTPGDSYVAFALPQ